VRGDVRTLGCQLLAAPGHKGLLGPLGTGVLYVAPAVAGQLAPLRRGGTGTRSDEETQPDSLPEKFEAGNLNLPGIAGLDAGVRHLAAAGVEATRQHLERLLAPLLAGLAEIPGVRLYGPHQAAGRGAVVSLNLAGFEPQELASLLDAQWSIQTRAGLHCAPRMHAALATAPRGTLRVSLGHFTTRDEIDALLAALADVAAG